MTAAARAVDGAAVALWAGVVACTVGAAAGALLVVLAARRLAEAVTR